MICNYWMFGDTNCEGKIRGYIFDQWPAPVTLCDKHFKMSLQNDKLATKPITK